MLRYKGEVLEMYGEKVKQVNKIAAKNAYERGETKDVYDSTFENVINDYRYYNCDNERGKYPIFFIKA